MEESHMDTETVRAVINANQRIDVRNSQELNTWAKSLDATPDEIKNAVAEVGPLIERVVGHLTKT
jgi:hypothetical protein